ncbi:MAG: copper chaperone PCu(A)C [Nitrospirae bacterium]|nr:copper chaperone PCu(A)C [Nitrospirota bacterium]
MTINPGRQGKFSIIASVVFLGAVILAACHSEPPRISIESPKAILSPVIYGEAMVAMTIRNDGGADVLKGVSTDIPGAKVSFHVMEDKRMGQVATVDINGGSSTVFKLGGSHVMIEDMPRTLVEGSPITLTLVFEKSGEKQLHLKLEKAPAMPTDEHKD